MAMGCQSHAPAVLPPERVPGTHGVGAWIGPQSRSGWIWRRENLLSTPGFEPRTVQPVANRYTDLAIPVHFDFQQGQEVYLFSELL